MMIQEEGGGGTCRVTYVDGDEAQSSDELVAWRLETRLQVMVIHGGYAMRGGE
ncbi:hypothetical protein SESBI_35173 [Sesbania bispinosa]|nr:hypothetical protein SESBI_35173 [Sesbania bispinosa]